MCDTGIGIKYKQFFFLFRKLKGKYTSLLTLCIVWSFSCIVNRDELIIGEIKGL